VLTRLQLARPFHKSFNLSDLDLPGGDREPTISQGSKLANPPRVDARPNYIASPTRFR